jgi:hypothetical protein
MRATPAVVLPPPVALLRAMFGAPDSLIRAKAFRVGQSLGGETRQDFRAMR